jgi:hypothetical protein
MARLLAMICGSMAVAAMLCGGRAAAQEMPGEAATKAAAPSAEDEAAAAKLVRDVFGEDYAKAKDATTKSALAAKLLQEARSTLDDPAARYVLIKISRDIYAQLGDVEAAMKAADEMAAGYEIDAVKVKTEIIVKAVKGTHTAAQSKGLAEAAADLVDDAARNDDFTAARTLADLALAEARKVREPGLLSEVQTKVQVVEKLAKAYAEIEAANAVLEKAPTDPKANLTVGKHFCFVKGDWEQGVPMLAMGSDPALKAAAEKDLAAEKDSTVRVTVADAWWDVAENQEADVKEQIRQRAVSWYRQAAPLLSGLAAAKAEKRMREFEQQAAAAGTHAPAEKKKGRTVTGRIFAACTGTFVMYVNGQQVLQGGAQVETKDFTFTPGDVISVMCMSRDGVKGFCCVIRFPKGVITTGPTWKGYKPANEAQWFQPGKLPQAYLAVTGDSGSKKTMEAVFQACAVRAPAVWGRGETCYLMTVAR